jgi:hypothetical protein
VVSASPVLRIYNNIGLSALAATLVQLRALAGISPVAVDPPTGDWSVRELAQRLAAIPASGFTIVQNQPIKLSDVLRSPNVQPNGVQVVAHRACTVNLATASGARGCRQANRSWWPEAANPNAHRAAVGSIALRHQIAMPERSRTCRRCCQLRRANNATIEAMPGRGSGEDRGAADFSYDRTGPWMALREHWLERLAPRCSARNISSRVAKSSWFAALRKPWPSSG